MNATQYLPLLKDAGKQSIFPARATIPDSPKYRNSKPIPQENGGVSILGQITRMDPRFEDEGERPECFHISVDHLTFTGSRSRSGGVDAGEIWLPCTSTTISHYLLIAKPSQTPDKNKKRKIFDFSTFEPVQDSPPAKKVKPGPTEQTEISEAPERTNGKEKMNSQSSEFVVKDVPSSSSAASMSKGRQNIDRSSVGAAANTRSGAAARK